MSEVLLFFNENVPPSSPTRFNQTGQTDSQKVEKKKVGQTDRGIDSWPDNAARVLVTKTFCVYSLSQL